MAKRRVALKNESDEKGKSGSDILDDAGEHEHAAGLSDKMGCGDGPSGPDSGSSGRHGSYFKAPSAVNFFSSGCSLLDLVLGGGWATRRIINIVGDRSTGKTLLAIEAIANFAEEFPEGKIWYREAEAAFDKPYAEALGMPLKRVDFADESDFVTVEDIFEDLKKCIEKTDADRPGLYVLDSLDALSDRAEQARGIDEGTFGASKAKKMSEMFRRTVRDLAKSNITVLIISQIRDNISASFGKTYSRSGGRSLDFYASQVIYLAQMGKLFRTIKGQKRPVGVKVKARCEKNKVGLPYRDCEFPLYFSYGVENLVANSDYLNSNKMLDQIDMTDAQYRSLPRNVLDMDESEYDVLLEKSNRVVREHWKEIEESFIPRRRKYKQAT